LIDFEGSLLFLGLNSFYLLIGDVDICYSFLLDFKGSFCDVCYSFLFDFKMADLIYCYFLMFVVYYDTMGSFGLLIVSFFIDFVYNYLF